MHTYSVFKVKKEVYDAVNHKGRHLHTNKDKCV